MTGSKYFTAAELACRGTGELKLAPGFLEDLDNLRVAYGRPMVVTSCCRTVEYNKKVRGHPRSLHLIGNPHHGTDTCAIDVQRPAGADLHRLMFLACSLGWSVGIAGSFIHLDRRSRYTDLPPIIYTY